MFSYYGSKSKIVDYYPPPKHKKIIEPFAGSARYSLKYWQNDVLIVDKLETIAILWKWLQTQTPNDILGLPNMDKGEDLRLIDIPKEARVLIGFCINRGSVTPKNIASGFNNWNEDKKRIAGELHKIKHWEIKQGCYTDLENETATWFIDPPYQFGGEHYKESSENLDFKQLAEWCKIRNGQTIVCENTKADWLPFLPMIDMQGSMFKTTEAIWSNHPTNYDHVQQSLFFSR
jgi:site-specific DNA-adenine methylase